MQFTLNVFRNTTDVILSSAFFGPYEFLKIEGITSKGGNLTQFQSTSMDIAKLETAFSIVADGSQNLFIGLSYFNHIHRLHTISVLHCRLSDGNV